MKYEIELLTGDNKGVRLIAVKLRNESGVKVSFKAEVAESDYLYFLPNDCKLIREIPDDDPEIDTDPELPNPWDDDELDNGIPLTAFMRNQNAIIEYLRSKDGQRRS